MKKSRKDKLQIRNSTVDFLVFTKDAHEDGIEVRVQNHDVWLTQKAIGQLFDVERSVVTKHLKNVFESGELSEDSVCAKFAQTADDGKTYQYKFYSLPAIIAVGYRINSGRATQFRQGATKVLDTFAKQGYVLDKGRLVNGQIFDEDYFNHLISEIQEIRASERRFYQKITDIYATAIDYSFDSQITKDFFATVQNKLHYAVHEHTAAEIVYDRVNREKPFVGMTNFKGNYITKDDVKIAKNYLSEIELQRLNLLVSQFLDFAELQALEQIPMTMQNWIDALDNQIVSNRRKLLEGKGRISHKQAVEKAEKEFEIYRAREMKQLESDFDRAVKLLQQQ